MGWADAFRRQGSGRLLRTLVHELAGIRQAEERQADALEHLVAHVTGADQDGEVPEAIGALQTGGVGLGATPPAVSYLDQVEAGLVADFIAQMQEATGHTPDEEEILTYLADEKTVDLHQRLRERETLAHLARTHSGACADPYGRPAHQTTLGTERLCATPAGSGGGRGMRRG